MKCIIVDDEPLAREGLEMKIQKAGFLALAGIFYNGMEANKFLQNNLVDLIFLDIQMPDISGLDLLRTMKQPPLTIITSAFSEYAIESFELDIVDFIVKPIEFQRFMKAVNKAREIFELKLLSTLSATKANLEYIYIRCDRQYIKMYFKDIRYVEGMKNYATFYLEKEKLMTPISLQQVQEQIPNTIFARVNKSYFININFVTKVTNECIIIEGGKEIPIGKTYEEDFLRQFIKGNLLGRK